ncbi:hypothetical protein [Alteribacillus iranensis]|uniref:Similar to spore coat protein n=1 Tax=Alteribacillus iranensis TaxID=930128 RepID=A0A1I2EC63_9BACI|nr:hypothetical protein [Alteribacillus iranensis]SFE90257.1 similar to spore coat protein [Alteribacillus iranensis]
MAKNNNYAQHEILEVHELLTVKSACAAKSSLMQGLATDSRLKELLEEDAKVAQEAIEELKGILEEAK